MYILVGQQASFKPSNKNINYSVSQFSEGNGQSSEMKSFRVRQVAFSREDIREGLSS